MYIVDSTEQLNEELQKLREENKQLKTVCENFQQTQDELERIIAETTKKQLLAEIDGMELGQIFSAITEAMWAIRDDGIIIRTNDAMLQLLGKTSEEVIGQDCCDFLDYGLCHTGNCPLGVTKSKVQKEYDIQLETDQGAPQYYIMSVAPLTTIVGTTAIVCHFKNITERKEAEQKLEQLNRALSEMARIDGLTKIANRRYFDEMLQQEWLRLSREGGKSLSLILADIDYFKKYNDHYGHQAGDDCLIRVGQALKKSILRPADLAARYGGEEFVLLLPDVDLQGAKHVGLRAIEEVANLGIEHISSDVAETVTLSMGVATLIPSAEQSPTDLVAMADRALYMAKEQGRNRLVTDDTGNQK